MAAAMAVEGEEEVEEGETPPGSEGGDSEGAAPGGRRAQNALMQSLDLSDLDGGALSALRAKGRR